MTEVTVTLNGEPRPVAAGTTVAELVAQVSGTGGKVAVEINREIVPRSTHGERVLAEGDAVELVTFVGGG